MPEPGFDTHNGCADARIASIVYGNKFLTYGSLGGDPYSEALNLINILNKPSLTSVIPHIRFFQTPAVNQESQEISSWHWKKELSTQEDLLYNEEDQVQELIFRIRTSLNITCRESLANRLVTLFNDAREEDFNNVGIDADSLRNFYKFLQLRPNLKFPAISLTPDCNIYASWRPKKNWVFSVHFIPTGDTRFVIFKPNDRHPERQVRLSGITTTDILLETVAPNGVLDWILE